MVKERPWFHVVVAIATGLVAFECAAGSSGRDGGGEAPGAEMCNGVDDDGDGLVDEGPDGYGVMSEPCTTECGSGVRMCLAGRWSECSAAVPGPDGRCPCTEGETRECATVCGSGVETCTAGVFSGCTAPVPAPEECGDGLDNDCDGAVDEDCADCAPGETRRCGTDTGECVAGIRTCRSDGTWGPCTGRTAPREEVCDGLDNDCDGEVDEDLPPDAGESNDTCTMARRLPDVIEGTGGTSLSATIYPSGDEDWLWLRAVEGWHDCEPFTGQCWYALTSVLDAPEGTDFEVCLYPSWPSDHPACHLVGDPGNSFCLETGESAMTVEWEGICMLDDSLDFVVVVQARPGSPPACEPYELRFVLDGPEDVCPGGV